MPPAASHPVSTDLSDQEVHARLTAAWVGIWMSVIVCLGAEVYALVTWNTGPEPRAPPPRDDGRPGDLAAGREPPARADPPQPLPRGLLRHLDDGRHRADRRRRRRSTAAPTSPFVLVLVLPFLYGALSYPLWATAVAGIVTLGAFAMIAYQRGRRLRLQRVRRVRASLRRDPRLVGVEEPVAPPAPAHRVGRGPGAQRGPQQARRPAAARGRPLRPDGPGGDEASTDLESEAVEIVRQHARRRPVALIRPAREGERARDRGAARYPGRGCRSRRPAQRDRLPAAATPSPPDSRRWSPTGGTETRFKQSPAAQGARDRERRSASPSESTGEPWGVLGFQCRASSASTPPRT